MTTTRAGTAWEEIRYFASTFGKSLSWTAADLFGLYYLIEIVGMDGWTAGIVILLFLAWAALCDPMAGWLADNISLSQRRWFLVGPAVAAAFLFVAMFAANTSADWRSLALIVGGGLGFRAAYALLDVPHNAVMAKLVGAGATSTRVGAARLGAAMLAAWASTVMAQEYLSQGPAATDGLRVYATVIAMVGFGIFVSFLPAPELLTRPLGATADNHRDDGSLVSPALIGLFLASSLWGGLTAGLLTRQLAFVGDRLFDLAWISGAVLAFSVGRLAAIPLAMVAAHHVTPATVLVFAHLFTALICVIAAQAQPDPWLFKAALVGLGVGTGAANLLGWSILALVAVAYDRAPGRLYGWFLALGKLASGISALVLGWAISVASPPYSASLYILAFGAPLATSAIALAFALLFRARMIQIERTPRA